MANTDFKLYLDNYSSNVNPKITNKMITGTICWIKQIIPSHPPPPSPAPTE